MPHVQELLTLYEAIGGGEAISEIVGEFYERILADQTLAPFFIGVEMESLMAHQRDFLTAAFSGPERYQGKSLAEAHAHLQITHAQFERLTQHLFETLRSVGAEDAHIRALEARINRFRRDIVTA